MTETMEATMEKVEVNVGRETADGVFTGEKLRFTGEEVGAWTEYAAPGKDDRGNTYTLYRTPDGGYRVHEVQWSAHDGEESLWRLFPEANTADSEGKHYTTYAESEARKAWSDLFAAIGMPNVRDID